MSKKRKSAPATKKRPLKDDWKVNVCDDDAHC